MLSIGKLAAGAGGYYTAMVADGAEEYFTGAREAPGEWIGSSGELLDLAGQVEASDFAAVLEHRHPGTGERVTAARSVPTVVAFDATFCAPKSVSILHGLGSDDVRAQVRDGHDSAVRAAFAVLEDEAARGRRGRGGQVVVEGDGLVAAAFRHRTSRAGDPHLHSHVVVTNLVHGPDDRWTALDARPLFHWAKTCGYLYEAQLRHELTTRLGVSWTPVQRGIADVAGVPKPVRDEFSTRRREIAAHLEASGFDSAKAAQLAAYATRRMKDHRSTVETLAERWQRRAEWLGFDIAQVPMRADPSVHDPTAVDTDRLFVELAGPDGLTRNRATFGRREVIQGICERLPSGAPVQSIIEWSDQFLESEHCVLLAGQHQTAIHTRDGRVVAARTDQARFTTPDMLEVERRLVDIALDRAAAWAGLVSVDAFEAATATNDTLSTEQYLMVLTLTTHGRGVEVVDGVAGSGKTYALGICRKLWETSGQQVIGCALAGKAARQLETDAGIPSSTIDRLLIDLDGPHGGLAAGTVVVVDEAAMVGTRKLLRLAEHAAAADAKLVLIGDPCQLPEIEAGGAFVGLGDRIGNIRLVENRRQTSQWERDALVDLRHGHTDTALDRYLDRGHITVMNDHTNACERLVDEWAEVRGVQTAIMLASRRDDVDRLNALARRTLHDSGVLPADTVVLGGRGYVEGDVVLALRNDRRLDVLNGTRAVIDTIDTDHQVIHCRTESHEPLRLPFDYAQAGHLTHGYAMTVHKAQGGTFDRCFVLAGDQLTQESAYTALSRARHGTDIYVVSDDPRAEDAHMPEHRDDTIDLLRASVRRTGAQEMAIESSPDPDTDADIDIGL